MQRNQHAAVGSDILQRDAFGQVQQGSGLAGGGYGHNVGIVAGASGREPHFFAVGPPRKSVGIFPLRSQSLKAPGQIHDADGSSVIPKLRMIQKSNLVAFGREANMADPAAGFINHIADWKLELALPVFVVNNRQPAVGVPIRPTNVGEHFAGRASGEGRDSQRSTDSFQLSVVSAASGESEFVGAGNSQKIRVTQAQRLRQKRVSDGREKLYWLTIPRRAIDDRLAVARETRRVDRALFKRQAMVSGKWRLKPKVKDEQGCGRDRHDCCDGPREHAAGFLLRSREGKFAAGRGPGESL